MDSVQVVNCFGGTIHLAGVSVAEDGTNSCKEVAIFPFDFRTDKVAFVQHEPRIEPLGDLHAMLPHVDVLGRGSNVPIVKKNTTGRVSDLPDEIENTFFIVREEVRKKLYNRKDLISPVWEPMVAKGGGDSVKFVCVGFERN